jgi:hypothetical protein
MYASKVNEDEPMTIGATANNCYIGKANEKNQIGKKYLDFDE